MWLFQRSHAGSWRFVIEIFSQSPSECVVRQLCIPESVWWAVAAIGVIDNTREQRPIGCEERNQWISVGLIEQRQSALKLIDASSCYKADWKCIAGNADYGVTERKFSIAYILIRAFIQFLQCSMENWRRFFTFKIINIKSSLVFIHIFS